MMKKYIFVFLLLAQLFLSSSEVQANDLACQPATTNGEVFRSLFSAHGLPGAQSTRVGRAYSQRDLDTLLYPIPKELTDADEVIGRGQANGLEIDTFTRVSNELLSSKMAKLGRNVCPDLDPDQGLRQKPLTLVFIPEFMSEFASSYPLRAIVDRPSSAAAQQWRQRLNSPENRRNSFDLVYDLHHLSDIQVPISETVGVSSIDSAQGLPLITVIFFKPRLGSLETIGSLAENRHYLLARLTRVFNILGTPEEFYFLGFSRGATAALDIASVSGHPFAELPWANRMRGVITLAGVNFGSLAADSVVTPGTPENKFLEVVQGLSRNLHGIRDRRDWKERLDDLVANSRLWNSALRSLGTAVDEWPMHPGFTMENPRIRVPPGLGVLPFLAHLGFNFFDLSEPTQEYFRNVERFKVFAAKLERSIYDLTTHNRLEWWKNHTLPRGIKLFAVGATFGDPTLEESDFHPIAQNPLAYNWKAFDTLFLRLSYYSILSHFGVTASDGLVSLDRSFFWPKFIKKLNPENHDLVIHNLGVAGVDHMGIATASAVYSEHTGGRSPYPREILFRSIASYVAVQD